jgi:hypothetical protein
MKQHRQLAMSLVPPSMTARIDLHWLDISDIAAGVGFTAKVLVSLGLSDALEPISTEADGDYDQRLYDALWLAHFQLARDQVPAATFNFTFPRKHWISEELTDASLRLRAETRQQAIFIGLLEDF